MAIPKYKAQLIGGAVFGMLLSSEPLLAQDSSVSFSGLIRQEMALNISGDQNPFNQHSNTYNGKEMTRNPVALPPLGVVTPNTVTRPGSLSQDNDWNLMATRVEVDMNAQLSNDWTAFVRLRGFFDNNIYKDFGDVNRFESNFWGKCGSALEICDENYMIDLPSAYLDYSHESVWLRIGNQQIAWGESIFFRVLDAPNGLDLRRHSFLDWASEEYADERVAAPAIRGSVRFAGDWELEGFVQMFSPTILDMENTAYNLLPTQFVRNETEAFDDVRGDVNTGLRLRGQLGELGVQFMAINRRNPDGYFGWTEYGLNPLAGHPDPTVNFIGTQLPNQPFEPFSEGGQGLYSAAEFHDYAAMAYVNGTGLVQTAVSEFSGAATIAGAVGLPAVVDEATASTVLDTFFSGLGNLRGHIKRKYPWENVFGFGANYMFFADPGSFLDQLIVRFETTYTPDKKFTNSSLSRRPIEADEISAALVVEKYQRFSEAFPSTYMVLQWLHKSESDMFGRHLSGYGGTKTKSATGRSDFDAVAFAMQQPSKTLMWRFDLAVLYDIEGGYLIQPGVRYKPNGDWTAELYGNFFDGSTDNQMGNFEWADEIGLRLGYQF